MGWLDGTQNLDLPGLPSSVFAITQRRLAVRREVAQGRRRSTPSNSVRYGSDFCRVVASRQAYAPRRFAAVKFHDRDYLDVAKSINRGILACLSAEDERHRQTIRS